ncbi:DUF3944 domain-containing protein [Endozoicomonas acroporae]|uniref:DUF3944 domain-containing protein n=1 Tax=Endozoicomonas acroporae TaxID=1701104 RepID=UPI003D794F40
MAHSYRNDADLEMLRYADNEMLSILVNYLTKDKDGDSRWTEELTSNPEFKKAGCNYKQAWQPIAAELQHFGGDTLVNIFRRSGVPYREILIDVCKKVGVKTDYSDSVDTINIEQSLLAHLFEKAWSDMTEEQKAEVRRQMKIDPSLTGSAAIAAIQVAIRMGGFMSYQIALIVANSVARAITGQGLKMATNAGISRVIGVAAGPIGWIITGLLTVPAISGPAFRVTLPCVIQIAAIRQQMLNESIGF